MSNHSPTDYEILTRSQHGWLQPYLVALDAMFSKRWDYWFRTVEAGTVLDEAIPRIEWHWTPQSEAMKNLTTCLQCCHGMSNWHAFESFIDWLLHGLGDPSVSALPKAIEPPLNAAWYKTFNLGLFLKYPYDYLGQHAAELYGSGKRNPTAYFPTPMHLSYFMAEMVMDKADKTARVCDPCVGSGRLLMLASNYSLNLCGQDIDPRIIKVCKANMWIYVPWCIYKPDGIKGLDKPLPPPKQQSCSEQPIQQTTPEKQTELMTQATQLTFFDQLGID